jgi:RHH-type proline utilization regulon transcriptional repressor/proline dehydrogenase/delta 1-pyrroline-5-carboxylate dehydrogenase
MEALRQLPDLGDPYADERSAIHALLAAGVPAAKTRSAGSARALRYIEAVRAADFGLLSAQNLLNSFPLATPEGIALLRLAEALLRAPDPETQTWLIAEKLAAFRNTQIGLEGNFVTRVLAAALKLAGHTAAEAELRDAGADRGALRAWLAKSTLRPLVIDGIRRFGDQFVFATNLADATARAAKRPDARVLYSYDMLGEGARTRADADRAYASYVDALAALKRTGGGDWTLRDGISVKLSAIHPRFETAQVERSDRELYPKLVELAQLARAADVNLTIDAEESERLALHIGLVERLMREPSIADWPGLGLAVQTYLTGALAAIDHVVRVSESLRRPISMRFVKGAYWDAEIKRAQELGMPGFPVFTHKWATDVAYLTLARRVLASAAPIYPQFASHNALTVAAIVESAHELAPGRSYEFQRLHGMGEPLYDALLADRPDVRVRVYAPVGAFRDLLAYLVRRLLENGSNTSFVHQITDRSVPASTLVDDPYEAARRFVAEPAAPASALPTGRQLFGERRNSKGIDLQRAPTLIALTEAVQRAPSLAAAPLLATAQSASAATPVLNPARLDQPIGSAADATVEEAATAIGAARAAMPAWDGLGVDERAEIIERVADFWEAAHDELVALIVREGGRTMLDAHLEAREAIDFCRYYAACGRTAMQPQRLPGPVGESNELRLAGRGVFVCISPWNFPLAIFGGQIAAALVAGNAVIAKPAEQTRLVAFRAVQLMHAAGVPLGALQFVPGRGETVGRALTSDPRVAGVVFTGSTGTARAINRALAARDAPIGVLIAETGGQNAMIVDSTALPEQVTDAVVSSAFRSCGQRCSALRVLFVQAEVADAMGEMIAGAMRELVIGDPADPRTDIGPVIDADQLALLQQHREWLRANGRRVHECELPAGLNGHFFAPIAYEIDSIGQLANENFGPILHLVRYGKHKLDQVIDAINGTGYGLTMGLHTRLDTRVEQVVGRAHAGNLYVNRNIIGAVVGSQPFGGEGLSGTGPKAGGPHYLQRFCAERTVTINTAAAGGNVELLA